MIEYRQLNEAIENQDLQQVVYWLEQCNPEIINPWTVAMAVGPTQNFEILKVLAQVTDMHREESCALRQAAEYNNLEAVQLLLPLSDAKACQSEALFWACIIENQEMFDMNHANEKLNDAVYDDDFEQVMYWLPQCNTDHINAWTVALAAGPADNFDILKALASVTDTYTYREDSCALRQAAEYKNFEGVQLLLPFSDAKACQSEALAWASVWGNQKMFDLLYHHSNPHDALQWISERKYESRDYPGEYEGERMIRERLAQEEKAIICQSLPSSISSQKNKKI